MNIKIDAVNQVVFFLGKYPAVLGIPSVMKRFYQGHSYKVLSYQDFNELDLPRSKLPR